LGGGQSVAEDGKEFDLVVEHFDVETPFVNEVDYVREDLVGVAAVIADAGDAQRSLMPGIVIVDLGDTDAELVLYPGDDRFEDLAFALEALVFCQAKLDSTKSDLHK
jgi:hypothetical protein